MQRETGTLEIEVGEGESVDVVDPPPDAIRALVWELHNRSDTTATVRVLGNTRHVEEALADWNVAARAADLVGETLELGTADGLRSSTVRATAEHVSVDVFGEPVGTTDEETRAGVQRRIDEQWADATAYDIETPSLGTVEVTLAEKLSADARDDFLAFCEAVGPVRNDDLLNERVLLVLAGARNREQNYEVGQWADYHGFSSRSMMNRVKTNLTASGVVEIEKESGHVGRPRQILTLPDELAGQSRAGLLDDVREALS